MDILNHNIPCNMFEEIVNGSDIKDWGYITPYHVALLHNDNNFVIYDIVNGTSIFINNKDHYDKIAFSIILKYRMNVCNISGKELAEKLDTKPSVISNYINAKTLPNYTTIKKISIILNCPINDLYGHVFL